MESLVNWMLQNILGPMMLPVFMLAILCMIAGARPEPVVVGFLNVVAAAITGVIRLLGAVLNALFRAGTSAPRRYPPRIPKT